MADHSYAPPRVTALYRFYDAEDDLLYVGISCELSSRLNHHAINQPWWPEVARMTVEWHADRPTAAAAEKMVIRDENPRCNIMHKVSPVSEPDELSADVIAALHRMAAENDGKPRTVQSMMLDRFMRKYCPR